MQTPEVTHPGPPPSPDEGRLAMQAWREQWRQYRRATEPQIPLADDDEVVRLPMPNGWAYRQQGCRVHVPDTRRGDGALPAWMHPHWLCQDQVVAFTDVENTLGHVTWWGVCVRHFRDAIAHGGAWRWAHDATLVSMTAPDDVENWLALYALGFQP